MNQPSKEQSERLARLTGYLRRDPSNPGLLSEAADAAINASDWKSAREWIDQGLKLVQGKPEIRFRLACQLLAVRDYEAAEAELSAMVAADRHPVLLYNLGYAQLFAGKAQEAVVTLEQLPAHARAEMPQFDYLLGRACYWQGEYEKAVEHLDKQLASTPGDREVLGIKAMVLLDKTDFVEAATIARSLFDAYPDDSTANLVLGSIAMYQNDPESARRFLQRTVEIQPTLGRAWSALAFTDLEEQKLEDARAHFLEAVKTMPNHLGTWHGLAWTQILLGDMAGARTAVDAAMAVDRTFSENHGTLAVLLIMDGQLEEADKEIKRGLRLNPKSHASQYARALMLAVRGDLLAGHKIIAERVFADGRVADIEKATQGLLAFSLGRVHKPEA